MHRQEGPLIYIDFVGCRHEVVRRWRRRLPVDAAEEWPGRPDVIGICLGLAVMWNLPARPGWLRIFMVFAHVSLYVTAEGAITADRKMAHPRQGRQVIAR